MCWIELKIAPFQSTKQSIVHSDMIKKAVAKEGGDPSYKIRQIAALFVRSQTINFSGDLVVSRNT